LQKKLTTSPRPQLITQIRATKPIGGAKDGQLFPVADGAGAAAGFDLYILDSLSVGDESISFYRHESLTPLEVLEKIVEHYIAWAVNRHGGRL
jgi:hypothetical protein